MICFENVTIRQGAFELKSLSFSITEGEYAILMGQTGCGKTTIIESICGLRRVRSGGVFLAGKDITNLPPAQREIGYVPQDRALFPTMRIDRQIEFGLLVRNASASKRKHRVNELAEVNWNFKFTESLSSWAIWWRMSESSFGAGSFFFGHDCCASMSR